MLSVTSNEKRQEQDEPSAIRKAILARPFNAPLKSWNPGMSTVLAMLRSGLKRLRHDAAFAQWLTTGRKNNAPKPSNIKVKKVKVPRLSNWDINGVKDDFGSDNFMNAEWVDVKKREKPASRVILYIHGGAYVLMTRRTYRHMTGRLAKYADARVLAIDYRLAPQVTYPIPIYDVLSAYSYLLNPPADAGFEAYRPDQICFAGDSAGGGLSTAAMLYCRDSGILPIPGAIATMSPWLDLTQSFPAWFMCEGTDYLCADSPDPKHIRDDRSHLYVQHDDDLTHKYASPVFSNEDPEKPICPMLIQAGDAERVRDDGIVFSQRNFPNSPIKLELYKDQVHVFQLFAGIFGLNVLSDYALTRMGTFIKTHTGKFTGQKPTLENESVYIAHLGSEEPFPDSIGIIEDGAKALFACGYWSHDLDDLRVNEVMKALKEDLKLGDLKSYLSSTDLNALIRSPVP